MNIFISIASYRDSNVTATVEDIYKKAFIPERIFCGVLLQNEMENEHEALHLDNIPLHFHQNIRVKYISYTQARGPLYARQIIIKELYKNEDYYFQIDSHMKFRLNFDQLLIDELFMLSKNSIITFYPPPYNDDIFTNLTSTNIYLPDKYVSNMKDYILYNRDNRILQMKGILLPSSIIPLESPYCAAGFLFGSKDILKYYPMEHYEYLFHGEEILLVFKLKPHFHFYSPTKNIASHIYYRHNQPKFWNDHINNNWDTKEKESLERLFKLFQDNKFSQIQTV